MKRLDEPTRYLNLLLASGLITKLIKRYAPEVKNEVNPSNDLSTGDCLLARASCRSKDS